MADIAAQQIVRGGLEPAALVAASATDDVPVGDDVFIEVRNDAGADITVTIETPGDVGGLAVADQAVVVTAGERRFIGPLSSHLFKRSNGKARLTYSSIVNVFVAAYRL